MAKYTVATPHLIEGTSILKNKPGFTEQASLTAFEKTVFSYRSMDAPEGDFSTTHLKKLHEHLLQDVYEWAGTFRDVPISKGDSRFCQPQYIEQQVEIGTRMVHIEKMKAMKPEEFAGRLADIVGELNAAHPFLDGNGRTIRTYAQKVAKAAGYDLEIYKLKGEAWNRASEISFLQADNSRLARLLGQSLTPERDQTLGR